MRYLKTKNMYKASNFEFYCDDMAAYSYGWWKINTMYKGKMVFNHTYYSSTTVKHQQKALRLLDYKYDLKLRHTTLGLQDIESALNQEIKNRKLEISSLIMSIRKKGTRKTTNARRRIDIDNHIKTIGSCRELLNG